MLAGDPNNFSTSTTFSYDQAGWLTDSSGPGGSRHTAYDDKGRVSTQSLDDAPCEDTPTTRAFCGTANVLHDDGLDDDGF